MTRAGCELLINPATTAVVIVDMQRLFRENTPWRVPGLDRIVPQVEQLVAQDPARVIFTRFMTPQSPEDAPGWWRRYYQRWSRVTLQQMSPGLLELVDSLRQYTPPATVVDKWTYSAFAAPGFSEGLARLDAETVVLAGLETDACVLATALDAIDAGYRAVIVTDGTASGSPAAHAAMLETVYPRLGPQIELATTKQVLAALASTK